MTHTQKAEDLIDKFTDIDVDYKYDASEQSMRVPLKSAKECAIIAVDEIMKLERLFTTEIAADTCRYSVTSSYEYWGKVKLEINKL